MSWRDVVIGAAMNVSLVIDKTLIIPKIMCNYLSVGKISQYSSSSSSALAIEAW